MEPKGSLQYLQSLPLDPTMSQLNQIYTLTFL
jgi:hypothetical protein